MVAGFSHDARTSSTYVPSALGMGTTREVGVGAGSLVATACSIDCRQIASPPRLGRSSSVARRFTSAGSGVRTLNETDTGTFVPGVTIPSPCPSEIPTLSQGTRSTENLDWHP